MDYTFQNKYSLWNYKEVGSNILNTYLTVVTVKGLQQYIWLLKNVSEVGFRPVNWVQVQKIMLEVHEKALK